MLVHHQSDKVTVYLDEGLFEFQQEFHDQPKRHIETGNIM